ncbi:short chain dehydrogenase family protein [Mycobacterium ulcerans str. Harvey]|uniref:Short chain dehydrogenase family protein n=1 Tax=Mycobacterium ulcerans str. Harvey TaxID=1299332 RepID=A0ABN0QWU7_MYCUL|nr:short chain dehydrogenase family protein [Mycobacterium ulcerans str. Harvey]
MRRAAASPTRAARGVAVRVDHRDDTATAALFERVQQESGRLDLLVNNAAAISDDLVDPKPFWEKPLALADVLDVGLRSSYVASWYAAPLLVAGGRGLIAFTSSPGRCVTCTARRTGRRRPVSTRWPPTWRWTFMTPASQRCRSGWASC